MITHDYKLIFLHVPKTGGRSISSIFNQKFDHFTAFYYSTEYQKFWYDPSYTKFTIVRNPYARLVSLYFYVTTHRRHKFEPIGVREGVGFKEWLLKNIEAFPGEYTIDSAEAMRGTDGDIGSPFQFSSQYRRIQPVDGDMPIILNFESGFNIINEMLQLWASKATGRPVEFKMPHENATQHDHWRKYYDDELIKAASSFFPVMYDCKKLGYQL